MKRILIAEDDPVMARLLEFNLKRGGYAITVCRDGLTVESQAREQPPDVAVFDLMLPGKNGQVLIELFKADPELKDIPLIVVTGQGKEDKHDSLLSAGAHSVYTKPFSPNRLLDTIRDLLGEKDHTIPPFKRPEG
ncbi:MAG: response regulator [Opitutales bacterium]